MATVARRIRAAKKKLSKVGDIESALTTGKAINDDQRKCLDAKIGLDAVLEELHKLEPLLQGSVNLEVQAAKSAGREEALAEAAEAAAAREEQRSHTSRAGASTQTGGEESADEVARMVDLLYVSNIFNCRGEEERHHAFEAFLSMQSNDEGKQVGLEDLEVLSDYGRTILTGGVDGSSSHKDALERCKAAAAEYIKATELDEETGFPVHRVRATLECIQGSQFFEGSAGALAEVMQQEVIAAQAAASAAAASCTPGVTGQVVVGHPSGIPLDGNDDVIHPASHTHSHGLSEPAAHQPTVEHSTAPRASRGSFLPFDSLHQSSTKPQRPPVQPTHQASAPQSTAAALGSGYGGFMTRGAGTYTRVPTSAPQTAFGASEAAIGTDPVVQPSGNGGAVGGTGVEASGPGMHSGADAVKESTDPLADADMATMPAMDSIHAAVPKQEAPGQYGGENGDGVQAAMEGGLEQRHKGGRGQGPRAHQAQYRVIETDRPRPNGGTRGKGPGAHPGGRPASANRGRGPRGRGRDFSAGRGGREPSYRGGRRGAPGRGGRGHSRQDSAGRSPAPPAQA
ncbi:unnamed protein product [Ostreobium quekettii]|uniref:Caprin-1 dimerization domain-containing protein n=1 Tax=Ostreobium quekettii TaxID=121088 RepID=A0A8S1JFW0_9CHLO|nr:unnamed protein product [Ostreobium quekettii]|eukprot:evm.model.scf_62EXC.6 EVM.evm.TU.scf_62EXC.6   scf_62EXC:72147-82205(-)